MPVTGWLRERWTVLLPALAPLGQAQEDEIRRLCEQEIASWRDERHLQPNSLRNPITDTRNEIRRTLPLTAENGWTNPDGQWEHLALKYLNLPQETWVQMNDESRATLDERLRAQQLLPEVDAIVQQAARLLQSGLWHEIAVGLAVCTGRRLAEVMKTATLTLKTSYSVLFTGQVKGRGRQEAPFEIPTLVRASLVLDALARLRRLVPTEQLEVKDINAQFGAAVRETAARVFAGLVPSRTGRDDLYTHLFRAVYARIAVYWYCPPTVADILYMATIQGHRFILEPEGKPGEDVAQIRLNYASNAHYFDYKIGDAQGNVDGRQGIKLGQSEVEVIAVFQQKEHPAMQTPEGPTVSVPKKYSLLRVSRATRDRFVALLERVKGAGRVMSQDGLEQVLLDSYEAIGTSTASEPLTLEMLGMAPKEQEMVRQAMAACGATDVAQYVREAVQRQARLQVKQVEREANRSLELLPTSVLSNMRDEDASRERLRRAVYSIMRHNELHRSNRVMQWYINISTVQQLVGGRKPLIKDYLDARSTDIEQHHAAYALEPGDNRKKTPIAEMITVPEEASAFPWGRSPAGEQADTLHSR